MHYETGFPFYALSALFVFIFVFGVLEMITIWGLGKNKGLDGIVKPRGWFGPFFKSAFTQVQILEYGVFPWVAHMLIFYGFIGLLILTTFEFFLTWLMPPHFIHTQEIYTFFKHGNGTLILAVWGDAFGLFLLTGVIMALIRRYIIRPEKLHTISEDSIAVWFLFILAVTGFACEAVRIAVRPEAADVPYSFAVYWMLPFLKGFEFTEAVLRGMFWFHAILSFLFIAYIPFSKFKHIFASPLVNSFVTAGDDYSKA